MTTTCLSMFKLAALLTLPLACGATQASWLLHPDIINNYDGDTFKAQFEIWPDIYATTSIRVIGVDTPEIRGKCAKEKLLALKAKVFTQEQLKKFVLVDIVEHGTYKKRMLGHVYINGERLDTLLINAGLGRANNGEKRKSWCND